MSDWLHPIRAILDQTDKSIRVFFRDDDAGWDDKSLLALLDIFTEQCVPIDIAVIPMALSEELTLELNERSGFYPHLLGIHQHGFVHSNHEREGRKCEFGASRSHQALYTDILQGRERLQAKLGQWLDPIFTPPWNRCSQAASDCLNKLGFKALSRNAGAQPLRLNNLVEIPVHIDWCKYRNDPDFSWMTLGQTVANALCGGHPIGIMFHHAAMNWEDRYYVSGLLALLNSHERIQCSLMRDFI